MPPASLNVGVTDMVAVGVIDGDDPREREAVGDAVSDFDADGVRVELVPSAAVFDGDTSADGVAVGDDGVAAGVGEVDGLEPPVGDVVGVPAANVTVGDGVDVAVRDGVDVGVGRALGGASDTNA